MKNNLITNLIIAFLLVSTNHQAYARDDKSTTSIIDLSLHYESRLHEVKQELQDLNRQYQLLKSECDLKSKEIKRLSGLKTQSSKNQASELREMQALLKDFKQKLIDKEKSIKDMSMQSRAQQQELMMLKHESKVNPKLKKKLESLSNKLEQQELALEDLNKELDLSYATNKALQLDISQKNREYQAQIESVETVLKNKESILEKNNFAQERELMKFTGQLEERERILKQTKTELKQREQELQGAIVEIKNGNEVNEALEIQIESAKEQLNDLKIKSNLYQKQIKDNEHSIEKLNSELNNSKDEYLKNLKFKDSQYLDLKEKLKNSEKTILSFEQQNTRLSDKVSSLKKMYDDLVEQTNLKDAKYSKFERTEKRLQKQLQGLMQDNDQFKATNFDLEQRLKKSQRLSEEAYENLTFTKKESATRSLAFKNLQDNNIALKSENSILLEKINNFKQDITKLETKYEDFLDERETERTNTSREIARIKKNNDKLTDKLNDALESMSKLKQKNTIYKNDARNAERELADLQREYETLKTQSFKRQNSLEEQLHSFNNDIQVLRSKVRELQDNKRQAEKENAAKDREKDKKISSLKAKFDTTVADQSSLEKELRQKDELLLDLDQQLNMALEETDIMMVQSRQEIASLKAELEESRVLLRDCERD